MTNERATSPSPNWGATTKLIVGLAFVGLVAALLIQFRTIIGPLLLALILTYLLHPIVAYLSHFTRLNWRMSVNLVYLVFIILIVSFLTLAGLAVVQQVQSLINVLQRFIIQLPSMAADLSTKVYQIGPFELDLNQFDLQALSQQLLGAIQPVLGRLGSLVSTFAASAAVTFGWGLFVMLISYFLLADAGQVSEELIAIDIPGYDTDIRRLGVELRNIWNAFLRGQFVIFILVIILYTILMSVLGVRYALGIAILAGLARFVPYVGPFTNYIVMMLVVLLQGQNYFGLPPWQHLLIVLGTAFLLDQILDNLIVPQLLGDVLGVHPAAVLLAAIIAANLIGLIGLVLAAPVVATLKLLGRYTLRKMLDLEAWPPMDERARTMEFPWARAQRRLLSWWHKIRRRRP